MSRIVFLAAGLGCVLLVAPRARAYSFECGPTEGEWPACSPNPLRWPLVQMPVRYQVAEPGARDLGLARSIQVVDDVFVQWHDVACSFISIHDGGTVDLAGGLPLIDGQNDVSWTADWRWTSDAIGVALIRGTAGVIYECDEVLNERDWSWTTEPSQLNVVTRHGLTVYAPAIVAQESGHCLGLGHSLDPTAVMYPTYTGDIARGTLQADDVDGICALYPIASGCGLDADCAPGASCDVGQCRLPRLGYGAVCQSAWDCASGTCARWPSGQALCSIPCDPLAPSAGCPAGSYCDSLECGLGGCVAGSTGALGDGLPCAADTDCASLGCVPGEDGVSRCGVPCDALGPNRCGASSHCQPDPLGCGACAAGASPAGLGSPCVASSDCAGRRCAVGHCSRPCGFDRLCPEGWICESDPAVGDPDAASCILMGFGALGDRCAQNGGCLSGICTSSGVCTALCSATEPCPPAFRCRTIDVDVSICLAAVSAFGGACLGDPDCLPGLVCDGASAGTPPACTRACNDFTPCPAGTACGPDGLCRPIPPPTGCGCGAVGATPSRPASGGTPFWFFWLGLLWSLRGSTRRERTAASSSYAPESAVYR